MSSNWSTSFAITNSKVGIEYHIFKIDIRLGINECIISFIVNETFVPACAQFRRSLSYITPRAWMSDYILLMMMDAITYPYANLSKNISVKWPQEPII